MRFLIFYSIFALITAQATMQCFQCDVTTNVMCDEPGETDCPNQSDQCRTLRNTTTNEIVLLGCIQGTAGLGGALTFTGCQASGTPDTNVTCCDTPLCNMNDAQIDNPNSSISMMASTLATTLLVLFCL